MGKYLDNTGLSHFWDNIKAWVKRTLVSSVSYDSDSHELKMTKYNGTNDAQNTTTVVSASTIVTDGGGIRQHQDISGKYDKTGGTVSGNVDIEGQLELDIEDEDYESGINMTGSLDNNLGTILTFQGYADNTNYRPILRNIGTPNSNYDAATKKYVDDNVVVPTYHLVELNLDGTVKTKASTLTYSSVSANFTDSREADYLDVIWENGQNTNQFTRFHVPCVGIDEVNSGNLIFITDVFYKGYQQNMTMVFTLDNQNILTTLLALPTHEALLNKVQSVVSNSTSTSYYPSTKAVFDEFQRKPVVVWQETNPSNYLKAIQADLSANPAWQLTNLDLTPYKRIKIYSCAGRKSSGAGVDASTTPAIVLEMSLDSRAAISNYGNNFVCSVEVQKPNDANRFATLTCAVSADKTKFVVLRQTNIYGTAATANDDANANVFMIEGYYD